MFWLSQGNYRRWIRSGNVAWRWLVLELLCLTPLEQYFSYIVVASFISGGNRRPVASHWQTLSHNVSNTPRHGRDSNPQRLWWYALIAQVVVNPTTIRTRRPSPLTCCWSLLPFIFIMFNLCVVTTIAIFKVIKWNACVFSSDPLLFSFTLWVEKSNFYFIFVHRFFFRFDIFLPLATTLNLYVIYITRCETYSVKGSRLFLNFRRNWSIDD